jgi:hypothetical protein
VPEVVDIGVVLPASVADIAKDAYGIRRNAYSSRQSHDPNGLGTLECASMALSTKDAELILPDPDE